jgi:eukaryotic-like serine/threonine-protein kinase
MEDQHKDPDEHTQPGELPVQMADKAPLAIGTQLGSYRIKRLLAVGGMGAIYEAIDTAGERVAVKCLTRELQSDADGTARFIAEIRATARIDSPHVVKIFEAGGGTGGIPLYYVMEFLDGQDLGDLLERGGPLSAREAVGVVLQACAGLAAAHDLGIVHRDFGIAKIVGAGSSKLTQTTSLFGSPAYMSPEQVRSTKNVDARADVWSLGVVLYELLSGAMPFDGENHGAILASIVADAPIPLRTVAPKVPPELEAIVMRCLSKNLDERQPSMSVLAAELDPFAGANLGACRQ